MLRHACLFILAACFAFTAKISSAEAHAYHTANVCSATAPAICAHVGAASEPNSTTEMEFMLHFMPNGVNAKEITNVAVQLWMEMGTKSHPGAPVVVTPQNESHYQVSKAKFFMAGPWSIKASFDYNGARHEIAIPIEAK